MAIKNKKDNSLQIIENHFNNLYLKNYMDAEEDLLVYLLDFSVFRCKHSLDNKSVYNLVKAYKEVETTCKAIDEVSEQGNEKANIKLFDTFKEKCEKLYNIINRVNGTSDFELKDFLLMLKAVNNKFWVNANLKKEEAKIKDTILPLCIKDYCLIKACNLV